MFKFVQLDSARVLFGNLYSSSGLSVFYFKLDSARVLGLEPVLGSGSVLICYIYSSLSSSSI